MKLGKIAAWVLVNEMTAPEAAAFAQQVEKWGYTTLWLPEAIGREPFVASSWLLANTTKLQIATGICSIWARDAFASLNGQYGLAEQSGGRFLLGLGVSHAPLVEGLRGHKMTDNPIGLMKDYLTAMQKAKYLSPMPAEKPLTVIAALGPKMLDVARTYADGAHPYNVTPDHTAKAREILGPGKLLCPEVKVVLETDPEEARAVGRRFLGHSLNMPNYRNSFQRMGFAPEDMDNGGSNRLIDSIVAWGDETAIRTRLQQHWDAGADQVCIQVLPKTGMKLTAEDIKTFELLAPNQ